MFSVIFDLILFLIVSSLGWGDEKSSDRNVFIPFEDRHGNGRVPENQVDYYTEDDFDGEF